MEKAIKIIRKPNLANLKKLTEGGFCSIYSINGENIDELFGVKLNLPNDRDYVIKVPSRNEARINFKYSLGMEYENYKSICSNRKYFAKYYKYLYYAEGNKYFEYLIMEKADKSLRMYLQDISKIKKTNPLQEQKIKYELIKIILNIFFGLIDCHNYQIVHRDIKPENILLFFNGENLNKAVISDFGVSIPEIYIDNAYFQSSFLPCTAFYAPLEYTRENEITMLNNKSLKEIFSLSEGKQYGINFDLWSLGVMIYEMFYHKHPYLNLDYDKFLEISKKVGNMYLDFFDFLKLAVYGDKEIYFNKIDHYLKNKELGSFLKEIFVGNTEISPEELSEIPCPPLRQLTSEMLKKHPRERTYCLDSKILIDILEWFVNEKLYENEKILTIESRINTVKRSAQIMLNQKNEKINSYKSIIENLNEDINNLKEENIILKRELSEKNEKLMQIEKEFEKNEKTDNSNSNTSPTIELTTESYDILKNISDKIISIEKKIELLTETITTKPQIDITEFEENNTNSNETKILIEKIFEKMNNQVLCLYNLIQEENKKLKTKVEELQSKNSYLIQVLGKIRLNL
ncbi:MAG: protein kinase [Ignavibacteria bacterium]|nr:protein kinase [Ignavibacteria bacterium]